MQILTDIAFDYSLERVVEIVSRGRDLPDLEAETRWAMDRLKELWRPRAIVERVAVKGQAGDKVTVGRFDGDETVMTLGPKAHLLAPAREALVCVSTIGSEVEARAKQLAQDGEMMKSYLLDQVGVIALSEIGVAFRRLAEREAAKRGWGVSPSLSPGSLIGWELSGQRELCSLVDLTAIGVELNQTDILIPFKSASALVGLGPDYEDKTVGSVCHWCHHRRECWRRWSK